MTQNTSNQEAEQQLLGTQVKNTETIRRLIQERDRFKDALMKIHKIERNEAGALRALGIADTALYGQ